MLWKTLLLALFSIGFLSNADAQTFEHSIRINSPFPNEEVCLGTSVPISIAFKNLDTVTRTVIVQFGIRNSATQMRVDSSIDTIRNIAPGVSIDTTLLPYSTDPNIIRELGTFRVCASVRAIDSSGKPIPGWPYKDTVCQRLFGVRRSANPFRDPSNNYSHEPIGNIPDQLLWVSLGATVVDGDSETWDPPPPRIDTGMGYGASGYHSPVIRLDRRDEYGNEYSGENVGDTISSFPINLENKTRQILTFDFMRGGRHSYTALVDRDSMLGPEMTVLDPNGRVLRAGDSLLLEFKSPDDSGCNPTKWDRIIGFDGGKDYEFKKFWMALFPDSATYRMSGDTIYHPLPISKDYFTADFRFRLRLKANDNRAGSPSVDDNDTWYVDNPTVMYPFVPELEMRWVRVATPYSKLPFSTLAALPVYVSLINVTTFVSVGVPIAVEIDDATNRVVYRDTVFLKSFPPGIDTILRFRDWDARTAASAPRPFTVKAFVAQEGYDSYSDDNQTYSTFYLNIDPNSIQEFAYDNAVLEPTANQGNQIPFITKIPGEGVGFNGTSGSYAMKFVLPVKDSLYGTRIYFAGANQSPDPIRISILQGNDTSCVPGDTVKQPGVQSTFIAQRGGGFFNQFWPYYFPRPIALQPGTYWLSVSQLSTQSFMMGGDLSRGSGAVTVASQTSPHIVPIYSDPYGTQYSATENNGDVSCAFALEVPAGSGAWQLWMPDTGYWPTNSRGRGQQAISFSPGLTAPYVGAEIGR